MDKIKVGNQTIYIHFKPQVGSKGRPFVLSGTRKNLQMPAKWIDKVLKYHWIYDFRYMDKQGGFFEIEIDYNDKYVKKNTL